LLEQYPNSLKIVFKNFPLGFHKFAEPAARAALAAAEQRKFWWFHDELFKYSNALSTEKIFEIAQSIGLDIQKFAADMTSPPIKQRLAADIQAGLKAGVQATPTVFVNGWQLKNRSLESFRTIIEKELKKSGKDER